MTRSMITATRISTLLVSAGLGTGLLLMQPAFAGGTQDQVVQIFTDTLKALGAKSVDQDDITGDDDKFTISGLDIGNGKDEDSFTIDSVTFVGAKPTPDGGISAQEVDVEGIEIAAAKGTSSAKTVKILGFVSAAPAKIKSPSAVRFDRFEATSMQAGDDANTVSLSYLLMTASDYTNGLPHKGTVELKGLDIPVNAADPQFADIAALGYKDINIDATFKGAWDDTTGRATLDNLTVSMKDAGDVQLAFVIGGLTPDVLKQLAAAKGDTNQSIGLLSGLSIESASLKLTNSSLFERAVDQQAKKQGTSKDELLHQGTAMLPMLLTSVQNPAFEKKVADAVTAFVATPHSLTLKIAPAQPVPVAQIIGVAGAAPQTLPDVLSADVTANK